MVWGGGGGGRGGGGEGGLTSLHAVVRTTCAVGPAHLMENHR